LTKSCREPLLADAIARPRGRYAIIVSESKIADSTSTESVQSVASTELTADHVVFNDDARIVSPNERSRFFRRCRGPRLQLAHFSECQFAPLALNAKRGNVQVGRR